MSSNPLEQNIFEKLSHDLYHEDYHVRYKAVRALGKISDERAIEPLLEVLGNFDTKDEENKVNNSASDALIRLGEAAIVPLLEALNKNPQHPKDGWRRYWVAQTLRRIGDKRAVEPLIRVLEDDDREAIEGAAEALAELGDKRAIEPLKKALNKPEVKQRGYTFLAVAKALRQLGGETNINIVPQREQVIHNYSEEELKEWAMFQPPLETLSVVNYELRHPVVVLKVCIRLLQDKHLKKHQRDELLDKMSEAVKRLEELNVSISEYLDHRTRKDATGS
jgi:bilin biosynthesis protein